MPTIERQIRSGKWVRVHGPAGVEHIEAALVGYVPEYDCLVLLPVPSCLRGRCRNESAWSLRLVEGVGARLAAFGLIDSAPWSVFPSKEKAEAYLDFVEFLLGDS